MWIEIHRILDIDSCVFEPVSKIGRLTDYENMLRSKRIQKLITYVPYLLVQLGCLALVYYAFYLPNEHDLQLLFKILIIEEEQVEEASAIFELLASEGPYIAGHCQSVL